MPSHSEEQRRLFGMVVAYLEGKFDNAPQNVVQIAEKITLEQAKDFARGPVVDSSSGILEKKGDSNG